jgi:cathepsin L
MRRALFEQRAAEVETHNAQHELPYQKGVNKFSDWSDKEFAAINGYDRGIGYTLTEQSRDKKKLGNDAQRRAYNGGVGKPQLDKSTNGKWLSDLPREVDWRVQGYVTAVKDQGQCGSCWSFGSAETIESHFARKYGRLPNLSEQNILDCVGNPLQCGGNGGCGGGTAELAYSYLEQHGGIRYVSCLSLCFSLSLSLSL